MKTKSHTVNKKLLKEFERFLEYAPAARLSRNLRDLLLWYLIQAEGEFFIHFYDLLADLTYLFTLLDTAAESKGVPDRLRP